jgi:hypothetical protein
MAMPRDLEKLTLAELRALARTIIGAGQASLRTKRQLVDALEAAGRPSAKRRAPSSAARGRPRKAGREIGGRVAKGRAAGRPKAGPAGGRARGTKALAPAAGADAAEGALDPEGFFVARVRGEGELRHAPHAMTEAAVEESAGGPRVTTPAPAAPARPVERLGDLPWRYGDDAFVALARDPHTLFIYWDHAPATVAAAFAGLDGGRAQLWIFARGEEGWQHLGKIDVALESRSYYVHDLEPGRTYRAEMHAVDRSGRDRILARPSNEARLPPLGPSPIVDDRFGRIPWDEPLSAWLRKTFPGGPFSDEARALLARLSDASRFSGGARGGSVGGPSSPPGPFRGG